MTRWMPLLLATAACRAPGGDDADPASDAADTDPQDSDTTTPADPPVSASDLVDPACLDGQWRETLPDLDADLGPARDAFADPETFLSDALSLRYPIGQHIFDGGRATTRLGDCVALFTSAAQRRTPDGMLDAASTLVHECGHFLDITESGRGGQAYVLTDRLTLTCAGGSYNDTPARSLITSDPYSALRPPCGGGRGDCDSYADIYLDGDPTDRTFDSGDQGLDMLMEEAVQYVNSLATDYAFSDRLRGTSISARDGILTFLWYIERYLRYVRVEAPRVHQDILDDPCWRELILSVWGRAWLHLEATDGVRTLGIDDGQLEPLVLDPVLLEEIQRVRDAEGCD